MIHARWLLNIVVIYFEYRKGAISKDFIIESLVKQIMDKFYFSIFIFSPLQKRQCALVWSKDQCTRRHNLSNARMNSCPWTLVKHHKILSTIRLFSLDIIHTHSCIISLINIASNICAVTMSRNHHHSYDLIIMISPIY